MPVDIVTQGKIVELRLNWPEVRNALGPEEGRELRLALEKVCLGDDPPAVTVITAAGSSFSAGGNLRKIVETLENGVAGIEQAIYHEFQGVFRAIDRTDSVLLSAVDGPAVGFGCDLALATDMTFIGRGGWLAQGWMAAGLIPATGGVHYVARRAGRQALWQFLVAGKVGPEQAQEMGLAVAAENAREAALAMAGKLAALPVAPLRAMRRLSRIGELDSYLRTALDEQVRLIADPAFAQRARALLGDAPRK